MTTLRSIAYLIKDRLNGGDSSIDVQLDERDIILKIRQKLNEVLKLSDFDNMKGGDKQGLSRYIATYPPQEVKKSDSEKVMYCDLPDDYVNIRHNEGIHSIYPEGSPNEVFVRSNNHYVARHLPIADMEGHPSYYLEGNKILFRNANFKHSSWKKMIIKLIVAGPSYIKEDDAIPLYADQLSTVVDQVTQYFSPMGIQDKLNDGNKDIGVNIDG